MRRVMNKVSSITESGRPLDEFSMVLLNNLLSIPLISILVLLNGEHRTLLSEPVLQNNTFLAAATVRVGRRPAVKRTALVCLIGREGAGRAERRAART